MANINFYIEKRRTNQKGLAAIYVDITLNKKKIRKVISKAKVSDWNEKKQRLILTGKNDFIYQEYVKINKTIDKLHAKISEAFNEALLDKRIPNESEILNIFINANKTEEVSFIDRFDEFIAVAKADKSDRTIMGYTTTKNFLQKFEKISKFIITWHSLDNNFIDKLKNYTFIKNQYQTSYYAKHARVLNAFLNWCEERDFTKNNLRKELNVSEPEKDVIFLSMEELMTFYNFQFEKEHLSRIRDLFCFACFTGFRYSDVISLKREHIQGNLIIKTQQKTGTIKSIPISKYAAAILEKYKDQDDPLPIISAQKTNVYLKDCCKEIAKDQEKDEFFNRKIVRKSVIGRKTKETYVPLHESITFHMARKTFITNSMMLGINIKVLQEMGAPKKDKDLSKYLKVTDSFKLDVFQNTWDKV